MLPTLSGRIQTRIFAFLVIGTLWAQIAVYYLPGGAPTDINRRAMYQVLLVAGVLGIGWELIYHGLMQFRWEKDWPTLFGLITVLNEGALAFAVLRAGVFDTTEHLPFSTFAVGFGTTWIVLWLFFNGPMRIFTVHWRFRGGRLL